MALNFKVTSPTEPGLADISGGAITVTDNGDGTWQLESSDTITRFRFDTNKADITEVEIIEEELTALCDQYSSGGLCKGCTSLINFIDSTPNGAFGEVTKFSTAWYDCQSLLSIPASLNLSKGTEFYFTWYKCSSLTSFPALNLQEALSVENAWRDCSNINSFPNLNLQSVRFLVGAWEGCTNLVSFPNLDMPNGEKFSWAWNGCSNLKIFPALDLPAAKKLAGAWQECSSLESFPFINAPQVTEWKYAFNDCVNLKCVAGIDTRQCSAGSNAEPFKDCDSLVRPNAKERAQISGSILWMNDRYCEEYNISPNIFAGTSQVYSIISDRVKDN